MANGVEDKNNTGIFNTLEKIEATPPKEIVGGDPTSGPGSTTQTATIIDDTKGDVPTGGLDITRTDVKATTGIKPLNQDEFLNLRAKDPTKLTPQEKESIRRQTIEIQESGLTNVEFFANKSKTQQQEETGKVLEDLKIKEARGRLSIAEKEELRRIRTQEAEDKRKAPVKPAIETRSSSIVADELVRGGFDAPTAGSSDPLTGEVLSTISGKERIIKELTDRGFSIEDATEAAGKALLEKEKTRLEGETAKRIETKEADVAARSAQDIRNAERSAERLKKSVSSSLALTGVGRSSFAVDKVTQIEEDLDSKIESIKKKADLENQLFKAQQEGADADTIKDLRKQISNEVIAIAQKSANIQQQTAEANEKLKLANDKSLQNILDGLSDEEQSEFDDKGFDFAQSSKLGYFADKDGGLILDKDNKPVVYKIPDDLKDAAKDPNLQFVAAKTDVFGNVFQPGGYFNKKDGSFTPINFGGKTDFSEFDTSETSTTLSGPVAEYTQVYKGSKFNPEGIDLAGKKGSAIKTPIEGEVIFVGDAGKWGTQVKVKDSQGRIHQFSHLDNALVEKGQKINSGVMLGTMGNSGQVLKGDGTVPTQEELDAGRGTHLDYTVFDANGKKMGLDVAMAYAGVENTTGTTSETSEAVRLGYESPNQLKVYQKIKKEGGTPPNLRDLDKQDKPLTGEQSKSVAFGSRMSKSLKTIESLVGEIKKISPLRLRAIRSGFVPNEFLTGPEQRFLQAEQDFLKASLRKESGAAIPPEEEASFQKTFGIQPGDSKETVEQKLESMSTMLETMIFSAGEKGAEGIKKIVGVENIPEGIDDTDLDFISGQSGEGSTLDTTNIELDQDDEDFFNNL